MNEKYDINQISKDTYVFHETEPSAVMDFLEYREENTEVRKVTNLSVIGIGPSDPRICQEEYNSLNVGQKSIKNTDGYDPEAAYEENSRTSGFVLSEDSGLHSVLCRPTAIPGLLSVTQVSGPGWWNLKAKNNRKCASDISDFLEARAKPVTVVEVFGRITGVASEKYSYMSQRDLVEAFLLAALDKEGELKSFNYSHEMTFAMCEFPKEQIAAYELDELGFDLNKTKMRMFMCTSDTRNSSAKCWFELSDDEKVLVSSGYTAAHRGGSSVERFAENCMSIHEALSVTVKDMLALDSYNLQYGESTIRETGRRCGISDKYLQQEIRKAKAGGFSFDGISAYEGYLFLCNCVTNAPVPKSRTRSFCGNEVAIESYIKTEIQAKIAKQRWLEIDAEKHFDVLENLIGTVEDADPNQISLFEADA